MKNAKYLSLDLHEEHLTSMLPGLDPYSEFRSNYPITSLNYIQPDSDPDSQDWEKGRSLQYSGRTKYSVRTKYSAQPYRRQYL